MDVLIDGEIVLYGIVGDGFWPDEFTDRDVAMALAMLGHDSDVTVRINSGGGYAMVGTAIHNALKAHRGKVTVAVDGLAASAASIIAMGGDRIVMRDGALMMIHDPASFTVGTAADHAKSVEALDKIALQMASIYASRTGEKPDAMRALMQAETWLTPDEAIAAKFADAEDETAAEEVTAFDYRLYTNAPERLVALATARAWTMPARRDAAVAANRQQGRSTMTDTTKTPKPAAAEPAPAAAAATTAAPAEPAPAAPAKPAPAATTDATTAATDERARISAIVNSEHAQGREALARHFAFETDMAPAAAEAALKAAPKSGDPAAAKYEQPADGGLDMGGGGEPGTAVAASGWKKAVAGVNARHPRH